MVHSPKEKPSQ